MELKEKLQLIEDIYYIKEVNQKIIDEITHLDFDLDLENEINTTYKVDDITEEISSLETELIDLKRKCNAPASLLEGFGSELSLTFATNAHYFLIIFLVGGIGALWFNIVVAIILFCIPVAFELVLFFKALFCTIIGNTKAANKIPVYQKQIQELENKIAAKKREIKEIEKNNRIVKQSNSSTKKKLNDLKLSFLYNTSTINNTLNEAIADCGLHKNYSSLICVCQFIQYLDTKRCYQLEGPNGCYNLYEMELRLGQIIDNLEAIKRSVRNIENSMYVLIDEQRRMNKMIGLISREISTIGDNLEKFNELPEISKTLSIIKSCAILAVDDKLPRSVKMKNLRSVFLNSDFFYRNI